jgi:hypothetical protein
MSQKTKVLFLVRVSILFVVSFSFSFSSLAGPYLDSTHGDTSNGVDRSSMTGSAKGNCGHCHEQHGTDLAGGPYNYSLFYDNYVSITPAPPDGLCFKCHDGTTNEQSSSFSNYSYSYRAGNWTAGNSPSNIADFFNLTHPQIASYHHLDDIVTFIAINLGAAGWGYTSASNPCVACHNPHAAQGDPEGNLAAPKSNATRGWLLSRPSTHAGDPWPLWGDDAATERMNNYTALYQAPYRFGSTTLYEPVGLATPTNGSNLTDFVTFCTDCHNGANDIASTTLAPSLLLINWANEKHGVGNADGSVCLDNPYDPGGTPATPANHVLSCMDCHESHGSPNAYILRAEVNGAVLGTTLSASASLNRPGSLPNTSTWPGITATWQFICNRCHKDDSQIDPTPAPTGCAGAVNSWFLTHHQNINCNGDAPYAGASGGTCTDCHSNAAGNFDCQNTTINQINCDACHFHDSTDAVTPLGNATGLRTF